MITDVKRERVAMTKKEAITVMQLYKDELEHRIAKIDYDIREIDLYSIHLDAFEVAIEALSAEAVIREGYNETDGVIQIEKQSAKDVGEIKHIVIHSPNYTRYFYNESMPISAEAVQGEWGHMIADGSDGSHWYEYECSHCGEVVLRPYNFCPNCGTMMYKDGDDTTGESL